MVYTLALELREPELIPIAAPAPGQVDKELTSLVFASPNQFDAGSCLFMANTGAMELLLNQRLTDRPKQMKYQGDTDLSERYLMNASDRLSSAMVRSGHLGAVAAQRAHQAPPIERHVLYGAGQVCLDVHDIAPVPRCSLRHRPLVAGAAAIVTDHGRGGTETSPSLTRLNQRASDPRLEIAQ